MSLLQATEMWWWWLLKRNLAYPDFPTDGGWKTAVGTPREQASSVEVHAYRLLSLKPRLSASADASGLSSCSAAALCGGAGIHFCLLFVKAILIEAYSDVHPF